MTDLLTTVPTGANGEFASNRTSPMERIGTKDVVPLVTGSHVSKTEGVTNPLRC